MGRLFRFGSPTDDAPHPCAAGIPTLAKECMMTGK
jgi:hypothetical protein